MYPRGTTNFSLPVPGGTAKPGAPKVELIVDYACGGCRAHEATNAANLKKWVAAGDIALSYNLRSFVGL
ncbi:hypothetical protein JT358_11810 [Micrococcales bacterium 31B]|nr:hypothetical protein [Micrococcales bacterium 31B]